MAMTGSVTKTRQLTDPGQNVKPTTKQLLNRRVQHSIMERGMDMEEMLREEPKPTNYVMSQGERLKLENKRLKNRLHAKQSRERRNLNFAKTEEECRLLKLERKILRLLVAMYHERATGQPLAWHRLELGSSPFPSRMTATQCLPPGTITVSLPQDIIDKLGTDVEGSCKMEQVLEAVSRLASDGTDCFFHNLQDDGVPSSNVESDALSHDANSNTPSCTLRDMRPVIRVEDSSQNVPMYFPSPTDNNGCDLLNQVHIDLTGPESVCVLNPSRQATLVTDTDEMDFPKTKHNTKIQSPWMVASKLNENVFDVNFNDHVRTDSSRKHHIMFKSPSCDEKSEVPTLRKTRRAPGQKPTQETFTVSDEEVQKPLYNKPILIEAFSQNRKSPQNIQNVSLKGTRGNINESARRQDSCMSEPVGNHNDIGQTSLLKMTPESCDNKDAMDLFNKGNTLLDANPSSRPWSEVFPIQESATFTPCQYLFSDEIDDSVVSGIASGSIFNGGNKRPSVNEEVMQYDPVSNLSSLNLDDGIFEEFEALEPSLDGVPLKNSWSENNY